MRESFFHQHLGVSPVVAILRGLSPQRTADTARACWDIGVRLVEVPLQGPESMRAFESVAAHADDGARLLGAGTVRTPEDVAAAQSAGARFLVSPSAVADTIDAAAAAGLPMLPGVMTPTDIEVARRKGCAVQKLFPAGMLGTGAVRALAAPFPDVALVAVGGVGPKDVGDYLAAGALGVGLGSALTDPEAITELQVTLTSLRKDQP